MDYKPDVQVHSKPDVEIPPADFAKLLGARAEMEYWAAAGNTVAQGWVIEGQADPFIPNKFQQSILDALNGRAMKKQQLADAIAGGDGRRLYRPHALSELRKKGLVAHKHGLGYYRPDSAPK